MDFVDNAYIPFLETFTKGGNTKLFAVFIVAIDITKNKVLTFFFKKLFIFLGSPVVLIENLHFEGVFLKKHGSYKKNSVLLKKT